MSINLMDLVKSQLSGGVMDVLTSQLGSGVSKQQTSGAADNIM